MSSSPWRRMFSPNGPLSPDRRFCFSRDIDVLVHSHCVSPIHGSLCAILLNNDLDHFRSFLSLLSSRIAAGPPFLPLCCEVIPHFPQ